MKPVDLPQEVAFNPDLAVVDTHVHLWSTPKYDYFAPDYLRDVTTSGHTVLATVYAECGYAYAKEGPAELRPVGETAHAVVQAELAQGAMTNVNAGILCAGNLQLGPRLRGVMEAHIEAGEGRLRGIRWRGAYHPDPSVNYDEPPFSLNRDVLQDEAVVEGARVLADMGLTLGALVFHTQLDAIAILARKVPDLTIAINHTGLPIGIGSYADHPEVTFREWSAAVRRLADVPNVNLQLGGIGSTRLGYALNRIVSSDEIVTRWQDSVDVAMSSLGADRVLFGSNFSGDRRLAAYGTYINAYKKMLSGYSDDEQRKVFSENAMRVFRIS